MMQPVQSAWDFMSQSERESYAWLAGIIDGEGCIRISQYWNKREKCRGYDLVVAVTMTHSPTLTLIKQICHVGKIYKEAPRGLNRKPTYKWMSSDRQAAAVLRSCLPFMVTKKDQAQVALDFMVSKTLWGHPGSKRPVAPQEVARRDRLAKKLKDMK
jgi:hypothetical protein